MEEKREMKFDFGIKSPDVPLKNFWRNNERFAALFNDLLFGGKDYVKPENLTEMDTEASVNILSPEFQQMLKRTRDIVKMSSDGSTYQILGIENQQGVHYAMPLRSLVYEVLSYIRQVEERTREIRKNKMYGDADEFLSGWKKSDRLKPCYTIVIYWGEKPWDGSRSLGDMMRLGSEPWVSDKFRDYPAMHLVCVNELNISELRNKDVHDVFCAVNSLYQTGGRNLSESLRSVRIDVAFTAAVVTGTMIQYGKILQEAYECRKESIDMCEAVRKVLREERLEGKLEGKRISSLNMLKKGFDYKVISEINEVTVEQVKAWEMEE